MILRKPFAFLTKNFKLIHLILSALILYLLYKSYNISSFLSEYVDSPTNLLDPDFVKKTIPSYLIAILVLLILGYIIITILLKYKDRPIKFYIFSITACLFSIFVYSYVGSTFKELEINLLDVRTLKLNQDAINTALIFQLVGFIVTIIRATGFNIKKFNFSEGDDALDIGLNDNEEFEVNLEFEEGKTQRKFNKFKRNLRYIILENKLLLSIIGGILIIVITCLICYNIFVVNKVYKQNQVITTNEFSINFKNSYYIEDKEKSEMSYIIVDTSASYLYSDEKKLETAAIPLVINDHEFYYDRSYKNLFIDLNRGYNNELLKNKSEDFLLIYKVPTSFVKETMYINYVENINHKIKVKLNVQPLESEPVEKEYKLKQKMDLKDTTLKNGELFVEEYTIDYRFKNQYNYCVSKEICRLFTEYVIPNYSDNYPKSLLKIKATYSNKQNKDINNFASLMNYLGIIVYEINGEEKSLTNISFVYPKNSAEKDVYYIEVPSEIVNSNKIYLKFNIRNKTYKYYLK